jgi:hypothetical protein
MLCVSVQPRKTVLMIMHMRGARPRWLASGMVLTRLVHTSDVPWTTNADAKIRRGRVSQLLLAQVRSGKLKVPDDGAKLESRLAALLEQRVRPKP